MDISVEEAASIFPGIPLVESPFFEHFVDRSNWDHETKRVATSLHRNGYAILDFPGETADLAERIKTSLFDRFPLDKWRLNEVGDLRIQDAWQFNDDVKQVACNSKIVTLLSTIYGKNAFPFQTLNFPVGTQQHFHSDSVHFSSMPERFMCGVWLALEDIGLDQGPLVYYPGSHRWPIYLNEHIGHLNINSAHQGQQIYEPLWRKLVEAHGAKPQSLEMKKGQALIWAANLLHGGALHVNREKTRWSQVTHYFFENCAYYTPMASDPIIGSIFFREPYNIQSGISVKNKTNEILIPDERVTGACRLAVINQLVRNAYPEFDPALYLELHHDVKSAGVDPFVHYWLHGRREGRLFKP